MILQNEMAGFLDFINNLENQAANKVGGFLSPFLAPTQNQPSTKYIPDYRVAPPAPQPTTPRITNPVSLNLNPRQSSSANLTPKAQATVNNQPKLSDNPIIQKMWNTNINGAKPVQDIANLADTAGKILTNPVQTVKNIMTTSKANEDAKKALYAQEDQIIRNKVPANERSGNIPLHTDYQKYLSSQEKQIVQQAANSKLQDEMNLVMGVNGGEGSSSEDFMNALKTAPEKRAAIQSSQDLATQVPKTQTLQQSSSTISPAEQVLENETSKVVPHPLIQEAAGSSEPRILPKEPIVNPTASNPIVKNEPMQFNQQAMANLEKPPTRLQQLTGTTPESKVAQDISENFSGTKNAQIVRGNQLADVIRKTVPNVADRQGMFWFKAAEGDTAKIEAALKDPKFAPYKDGLQAALNLSPQAKAALGAGEQYYNQAGQVAKDLGSTHNIVENYQNRIYQPEPPKSFVNSSIGGSVKTFTSHGLQRTYPDEFAAVEGGKKFATTDFADALAIHNQEMAGVNTSRQLTKAMSQAGIGKWVNPGETPEGWKPVEGLTNKIPFVDKATGETRIATQNFTAPEHLANGLKAVTEPNFIKKIDGLRGTQAYQGIVKAADLSYSFYHHATMMAQLAYQTKGGLDILKNIPGIIKMGTSEEFPKLEQDFAQHTGTTTKFTDNQDILRSLNNNQGVLGKVSNAPVIKQAIQIAGKNTDILFNHIQRYMKVMDYSQKAASWVAKHPTATNDAVTTAKRSIAKEVNAAYGGLNWEAMGVTKSTQSLLRLVLLAPDWTISNLQLGKMALGGGPGGAAARAHLATALIGGVLTTEMLSKTITGHFTDQNPKGHELEVQIAPDTYLSLFRGPIGDMLKLASQVTAYGAGGTFAFAQGKASPLARTLISELSNTDYYGQQIRKSGESAGKNTLGDIKNIASNLTPIPFGASPTAKQVQSGTATIPGTLATALGVAKYSPKQFPTTPANKGNWITRFTGTPQEKQAFATADKNMSFMDKIDSYKKGSPEQLQAIQDHLATLPTDADRKAFAYKLSTQGYSIKGVKTSSETIKAAQLYQQWSKLPPDQADAKAQQLQQDDPATYDALVREAKHANLTPAEDKLTGLGVKNGERAQAILAQANKLGSNSAKNSYLKGLEDKGVITDPVKQQIMDLIGGSK